MENTRQLIEKINELESLCFQLKNMIDNLPGDIYWKDNNGTWIGLNKRCVQSLQRMGFIKNENEAEIIGKTDYEIFNKSTADEYRKNDLKILNQKIEITIEERTYLPNGEEVVLLSTKKPIFDQKGCITGIMGNTIDITYLKKIESELMKAKNLAEAANLAKTEFIANMSHDIRTPLTGVIGLSEMLESTLETPEQKENAHLLHDSGEELLNMLNDILDDVRADHMSEDDLQEESFDLYECLDDLIKLELPTTKIKNLGLKLNIAPDVPQFLISDRKKIQRILLNLVGNAIKFTQSGLITIEVTCLDIKKSRVHLQFGVADTGIGIPKELQDQVFDRFFRVSSSYKGLYQGHGLGLHIAQSYVSLLGGHITLTSEEGIGSTFYFDLSCKQGHKVNTHKDEGLSPKSIPVSIKSNKTTATFQPLANENSPYLLLVEDNPTALKILENLSIKNHCRFSSAQNGEDALALAKENHFDLIITDIGLPGMSGIELTQAIRTHEKATSKPLIPIIGLTAHALQEASKPCIDAGMSKVLQKPMKPDVMQLIMDVFLQPIPTQVNDNPSALLSQTSSKLGIDLPDTEEELFQLGQYPILDIEDGIKCLGSDALLKELLIQMTNQDIPSDLKTIQKAFEQEDWEQIEKIVHKMKGGAVYCGIIRLKMACQYLERYYKAGHRKQLPALYEQLTKVIHETVDSMCLSGEPGMK